MSISYNKQSKSVDFDINYHEDEDKQIFHHEVFFYRTLDL